MGQKQELEGVQGRILILGLCYYSPYSPKIRNRELQSSCSYITNLTLLFSHLFHLWANWWENSIVIPLPLLPKTKHAAKSPSTNLSYSQKGTKKNLCPGFTRLLVKVKMEAAFQSWPSNKLQQTRNTAATHRDVTTIFNQLYAGLIHYWDKVTGKNGICSILPNPYHRKREWMPINSEILQLTGTGNVLKKKRWLSG